jgi:hypothetical protein
MASFLYAQKAKPETKPAANAETEAKSQADVAGDATAMLVIYRPKRYTGWELTPSVYVDGEQVARLDNGRYFVLTVKPGTHRVESSMKHDPLELEVKTGEPQYLEMVILTGNWSGVILTGNWRGGGRLIPTGQSGQEAVKKLKPLDKKWIMSRQVTSALPGKDNAKAKRKR